MMIMRHRFDFVSLSTNYHIKELIVDLKSQAKTQYLVLREWIQKQMDEIRPTDPYRLWDKSLDKKKLLCYWKVRSAGAWNLGLFSVRRCPTSRGMVSDMCTGR